MRTPRLIIGAAALFWGWQIGLPAAGLAVALLAEGTRYLPWRIAATRDQLQRIADFCTVLLALALAWLFAARGAAGAVLGAFQWLPLALLPLATACALTGSDALDLSVLLLFMRRRLRASGRQDGRLAGTLHFGYAYVAVLLIGASIANRQGASFYLAAVGFALWASLGAAWPRRPRRAFWLAFGCAALLGYGASLGLHTLQAWLTEAVADWFVGGGLRSDPYRSRSSLGTLGRLKANGRIIGRVFVQKGERAPELLMTASYDRYRSPDWIARDAPLAPVAAALDGRTWPLGASVSPSRELHVVLEAPEHAALLALPRNSFELQGLLAEEVNANRLGALRARMAAPRIPYTVRYSSSPSNEAKPRAADLEVPTEEIAALDEVLAQANAKRGSPPERLRAIGRYLAANYRYTLYREAGKTPGATPLARFLLDTRAGHCEFFATATVLLARRAGIPARYATGFAVQEWSDREGAYLLRARHAHAWTEVWTNGAWTDLDTTPADWSSVEADADGSLRAIEDLWQWLAYTLGEHPGEPRELPWWLFPAALVVALLYFAARLFFSRRERFGARRGARRSAPAGDHPLRAVEQKLARAGQLRLPGESLNSFAARVARSAPELAQGLDELFALRYRQRFDPDAPAALGEEISRAAARWLASRRAA